MILIISHVQTVATNGARLLSGVVSHCAKNATTSGIADVNYASSQQ
jgi:hypothetical protein